MESPFPTDHSPPYCRKEYKERILLQMQDPPTGLPGNQMAEFLKYLVRIQIVQIESAVVVDQPNLRRQASLKTLILLKPSPPSFFGKQTDSHLTRLLLVLSEEADHRKFLMSLSMEREVLLAREWDDQRGVKGNRGGDMFNQGKSSSEVETF